MNLILRGIINKTLVVVALFVSILFLVTGYNLQKQSHVSFSYYLSNHHRKPITVADIVYISPWMTFEYVNKVFELPDGYLKDTLQIEDNSYPRLTIKRYAQKANVDPEVVISAVQNDVKQYLLTKSTP